MVAKTQRKKKFKLSISKKRYNKLVTKSKLTKHEKKLLNDALYVKYCRCLIKFKTSGNELKGYPICMNSVYKKRGIKPPKNASKQCNVIF
jgi:hypothetical protein